MDTAVQPYASRILDLYPDLDLSKAEFHGGGMVNAAVIADGLVFRFAREERFHRTLARELMVLDRIQDLIAVPIPRPIYRELDFVVYRLVPGDPLLNPYLRQSSAEVRAAIATDLGKFFFELHHVSYDGLAPTPAPVGYEAQAEIRREARELVYPHLMPHQVEWAEGLFDSMLADRTSLEFEPTLIHGDVMPYHFLVDKEAGRLTGVIDFGVSGVGDPASDIAGLLMAYGESFVRLMATTYPEIESLLPRARYRSQTLEIACTIQGIKSNNPFWFTVHLGGARDIGGM